MREVFERAAALVEQGWTQGRSACNSKGDKVRWESAEATCFCMMGALSRALWPSIWTTASYSTLYTQLRARLQNVNPFGWNDTAERTQAEVVEFLRMCAAESVP